MQPAKRYFCHLMSTNHAPLLSRSPVCRQEAESNRLCRRLQLKDIIPVEMQRLTKYPLLLDNIIKYTGSSPFPRRVLEVHLTPLALFPQP